jgi:hypothetical protein
MEQDAAHSHQADRLRSGTRGFPTDINDVCTGRFHRLIAHNAAAIKIRSVITKLFVCEPARASQQQ